MTYLGVSIRKQVQHFGAVFVARVLHNWFSCFNILSTVHLDLIKYLLVQQAFQERASRMKCISVHMRCFFLLTSSPICSQETTFLINTGLEFPCNLNMLVFLSTPSYFDHQSWESLSTIKQVFLWALWDIILLPLSQSLMQTKPNQGGFLTSLRGHLDNNKPDDQSHNLFWEYPLRIGIYENTTCRIDIYSYQKTQILKSGRKRKTKTSPAKSKTLSGKEVGISHKPLSHDTCYA